MVGVASRLGGISPLADNPERSGFLLPPNDSLFMVGVAQSRKVPDIKSGQAGFLLPPNDSLFMVGVAQLARAPDCGSGGCGFEPRHSPQTISKYSLKS